MMQQTDKYKLNLLETSDAFSPNPLNENAQKTEAALTAVTAHADAGDAAEAAARQTAVANEAATRSAADAALDQRVKMLELRRFATGYYIGNGEKNGDYQIIQVGFTPTAVIMQQGICLTGISVKNRIEIVPGGFKASLDVINTGKYGVNTKGISYTYFAFA